MLLPPIVARRQAGLFFEEFREVGLRGEAVGEGYLLHRAVGGEQDVGYGAGRLPVDDVLGREASHPVSDLRQVGGTHVEAVGIEGHVAVGAVVVAHEGDEPVVELLPHTLRPLLGL